MLQINSNKNKLQSSILLRLNSNKIYIMYNLNVKNKNMIWKIEYYILETFIKNPSTF